MKVIVLLCYRGNTFRFVINVETWEVTFAGFDAIKYEEMFEHFGYPTFDSVHIVEACFMSKAPSSLSSKFGWFAFIEEEFDIKISPDINRHDVDVMIYRQA